MFLMGLIIGTLFGILVVSARDFRDLKNILNKRYGEVRRSAGLPITEENVLNITPEGLRKIEEDERNEIWYGDKTSYPEEENK